jgi:hypothetical protein
MKNREALKYVVIAALVLAFLFRGELSRLIHPPDPAEELLRSGVLASQKGDFNETLKIADNFLKLYPNSDKVRHAHLLKGLVLQKVGKLDEAATELHIVTEHYPGTEEARVATVALREIGTATRTKPRKESPEEPPDPHTLHDLRSPGNFIGTWRSEMTTLEKQGVCMLTMEIRVQEQGFSAFPTLQCRPLITQDKVRQYQHEPLAMMQAMALRGNPLTAVLSGAWDKDYRSIIFHLEKLTSTNVSGCAIAGDFTVTPFGGNQVAAEWKDSCAENPQFMLTRLPPARGQQ